MAQLVDQQWKPLVPLVTMLQPVSVRRGAVVWLHAPRMQEVSASAKMMTRRRDMIACSVAEVEGDQPPANVGSP